MIFNFGNLGVTFEQVNLSLGVLIDWSVLSKPPTPAAGGGDEKLRLGYFGGIQLGGRS